MKRYLIYARDKCPYCKKLLDYMLDSNKKFTYILMHNLDDELKEVMNEFNWRTVPMVIEMEDGNEERKFIGGCDDAIKFFERGSPGDSPL